MESFSAQAKSEICGLHAGDCCVMAELCAMTFAAGVLSISSEGIKLKYNTESLAVAKRIYATVTGILKLDANVLVSDNLLKKRHTYTVAVENGSLLLDALGLSAGFLQAPPPSWLWEKDCCKVALLRGAFLAGGSVSNPHKNYHFEFVVNSPAFAALLKKILNYFKIKAKTIHRKQNYVVYLNEGDSIADLLAMIGAHTSILNMENVRVMKELRNNVNRAVNCETANINKTVNAAMRQLENIRVIEDRVGVRKLSPPLREAALLRLSHPEATLQELCEAAGTTKSGMNHRLRKLNAIATALTREEKP